MKVHKSSQELQETIEGYKMIIEEQKKEINTPSYRWCTQWIPANNFEI